MNKLLSVAVATLLVSSNALAEWSLVNNESNISYISTKNAKVSEVNHFKTLNGVIDDNGAISVGIELGSVETNIPIRNDRMQSMLFEVVKYSKANISASIDPNKLKAMKVGSTYRETIKFDLSLHGFTQAVSSDIKVIKLSRDTIIATSVKPIIINADQFGLEGGVEQLRKVAKLSSISTAVPVTFNLTFTQK